jgi:RNA polymerase sigma-70 factor (ECF subfamily)
LKVFNKIDQYDVSYPFKSWLRRILLNTAIDYHRKNDNLTLLEDMGAAMNLVAEDIPMPKLSPEEDVLPILQKLSPAYRMVFNLYVLEGYSHREIAEMLGIEVRSSRSNLVRAVQNLRALMLKRTDIAKLN